MKKTNGVLTLWIIFSALLFSACSKNAPTPTNTTPASTPPSNESPTTPENTTVPVPEEPSLAEQLLQEMTLDEKVGQLFMIRPDSLRLDLTAEQIENTAENGVTELDAQMRQTLEDYPVGGIALFSKNISKPEQLTAFVDALQGQSKVPLLIGVDEEGGRISRIANTEGFDVPKFESMQAIGATAEAKNARQVGVTIGAYLKQYGVNLDFAPVADTNTNPQNIVIGDRSFGSDPLLVAQMVSAEIMGLHESGVMSCIKHFPGHGDTKGDTHEGYVSIDKTWDELKECELVPFISALDTTDAVMVAHITMPNVTDDGRPASLSSELIQEKLRKELGYWGVVMTDSLEMGAVTQEYSSAESAVQAILAGNDIILMPVDFVEAYQGVYTAVQNGTISEARINESVLRILSLKEKYGLLQ